MRRNRAMAVLAGLGIAFTPLAAAAQDLNITRSVLPTLPYTIIYPEPMVASGGGDDPVTINHPNAPLQCSMSVVSVEDTDWTPDAALAGLDDAEIVAAWSETFPGFAIGTKALTSYQDTQALIYDGTSTGSAMDMPITLVHTETVTNGRGYVLDCFYAADQAEQARPIVDFIIANFSTRADADCCVGQALDADQEAVPAQ